jgi:UDP:flavonoid glycosyltransferase YjiC (YdhE family)
MPLQGARATIVAKSAAHRGTAMAPRARGHGAAGERGYRMRVLFTVSNWPGHYFPMVPLGWALQSAGHEVRVACTPGDVDFVNRAGLSPLPVLQSLDMIFMARLRNFWNAQEGKWPYPKPPLHPVTGEEMETLQDFDFMKYMKENKPGNLARSRKSTDDIVEFGRRWRPDIVIHDMLNIDGLLLSRILDVPALLHLWGPSSTEFEDWDLDPIPEDYAHSWPRHGVEDKPGDLIHYVIDPCPAGIKPPTRALETFPVRYIPYNGPGAMPTWTLDRPEKKRLLITWGNSVTRIFGPQSLVIPEAVRAVADLDIDVLVTANPSDLGLARDELPGHVKFLEHTPLNMILPSCDAMVNHGGGGSVMSAVVAGVPQFIVPNAFDQYANGRRVSASGAAIDVPAHLLTRENAREAIVKLLDEPSYQASATKLREQSEERPTPAQLVKVLEDLAGTGRVKPA